MVDAAVRQTVEPVGNYLASRNSAVASDLARLSQGAADLPVDVLNACEEALPFWLFVSKSRMVQEQRNAFTLGVDAGRLGYTVPAPAQVRRLHSVGAD